MAHQNLFLFRVVGGKRVRFQFTIDANMTILEERAVAAGPRLVGPLPTSDPRRAMLTENGCTFEVDEVTGQVKITSVPSVLLDAMKIFSTETPCEFAACEEIRAEFLRELEAAGGSSCPACERGAITRRLYPKAKDAILKLHEQHSAKKAVSDPGA